VTGTRERILDATSGLFRVRGYTGTGMKQVVARAEAPFGSVYHFFPGGKEQLAGEAIERAGRHYHDLVLAVFDAEADVVAGTRAVFDGAGEVLRVSGYEDACPIATVALEVASTNDTLRQVTADVFAEWIDVGAQRFAEMGVSPDVARELVTVTIAALEGGFLLCRAAKSTDAMRVIGRNMAALVAHRLGR
jgi:AcrR family transcriptional regulator